MRRHDHRHDPHGRSPRCWLAAARDAVGRQTWALLAVAALIGRPTVATAQEMAVPVDLQLTVFARALSYDRSLPQRAEGTLVMGIVYQREVRASVLAKDAVLAWVQSNAGAVSKQIDLKCVPIALTDTTDLRTAIQRHHVDVLYVAPLRSVNIGRITRVTREERVLTLSGVASYVRSGIAFGVDEEARRTRILINLPASKDEGSDFTAQLLAVSQVIDGEDE